MKQAYPVIFTPDKTGFTAFIPDFEINTQGDDLCDVIEMSRDAIGLMGIDLEDDKKTLPTPSKLDDVKKDPCDIVTLVDVDFTEYRRKNERRTVKKNCTLPSWLCYEAEQANINFSQVLQDALKRELDITE